MKAFKLKPYLLIFSVLFTSGYPLSTSKGNILYYLLIIPTSYFLLINSNKDLLKKNKSSLAFILLLFLVITSFVVNFKTSTISSNLKFILVLIFSYLFVLQINFKTFQKYFSKTLKIISIVSFIGYFIINFTSISILLPTFTNVNDVEYYNGFIFFAIKSFGAYGNDGLERNIGAFWEPGLFATYLLVGIVLELWNNEASKKNNILIFLLALFTTKSTFGYLMLLPIIVIFFSERIYSKRLLVFLNIFIILGTIFITKNYSEFVLKLNDLNPKLFGKLIEESASVSERIESPEINLKIFNSNPIFGSGIGNTEKIFTTLTDSSQTSTSTYFLAAFGFLGVSYTMFFIYGILKYNNVNFTSRLMFLLIIITQINKEPHIYFSFTFIVMFYFLKSPKISNNELKKQLINKVQ